MLYSSGRRRPVARVAIYCASWSKIEGVVGWKNISFCPFILVIISKLIPRMQLLNEVTVSFH